MDSVGLLQRSSCRPAIASSLGVCSACIRQQPCSALNLNLRYSGRLRWRSLQGQSPVVKDLPSRFPLVICDAAVQLGGPQQGGTDKVAAGTRIRVVSSVVVYHVQKRPNLQLQGMEGEMKEVVDEFKGKPISANLPYKVQFEFESDGKKGKFFAHLKRDEFELV